MRYWRKIQFRFRTAGGGGSGVSFYMVSIRMSMEFIPCCMIYLSFLPTSLGRIIVVIYVINNFRLCDVRSRDLLLSRQCE